MSFKLRRDLPRGTTFAYRNPPRSGNEINGLGERSFRQAEHVFHNDGTDSLPWDALDRLFSYVNSWKPVLYIMKNIWHLRKSTGPAAPTKRPVSDPAAMTREVTARARALGADLVGVTTLKPAYLYSERQVPYRYVISIGVQMNRQRMRNVPDDTSAGEVMRVYARIGEIASGLSEEIRRWGWPARAYGNPNSGDLLQIPIAIDCGLGELGKHGSLISIDHGSNFRLGCVATDLPLAVEDVPADIGVDDLCARCTACARACPVDAIDERKQWVRGVEKWYVDFDQCIYYFCETGGCAICIEVCPWSEEGVGHWLSEKLILKRGTGRSQFE